MPHLSERAHDNAFGEAALLLAQSDDINCNVVIFGLKECRVSLTINAIGNPHW
jgi:hypothetical protein